MRILKFKLESIGLQTIEMPRGAQILDVQVQRNEAQLWALCDESTLTENRHIAIYMTGQALLNDPGRYIATFQMNDGELVFHAFEMDSNTVAIMQAI